MAAGALPAHDVVVTNPPFSDDHIPRLLAWALGVAGPADPSPPAKRRHGSARPFFALLPAYVANKPYYHTLMAQAGRPPVFFVAPTAAAYAFVAPSGARSPGPDADAMTADATSTAAATGAESPTAVRAGVFQCVWFVHLGAPAAAVLARMGLPSALLAAAPAAAAELLAPLPGVAAVAAASVAVLPRLVLAAKVTPAERRWRKKLRAGAVLRESPLPPAPGRRA
jgi:hypothetical protein